MPTGYTACVEDGSVCDLKTFVIRCSEGFLGEGCTVLSGPRVDNYYREKLAEVKAHLADVQAYSAADIARLMGRETAKDQKRYEENCELNRMHYRRHHEMLAQVQAWQVPDTVVEFKEFLIKQLKGSMKRCFDPSLPDSYHSGAEWYRHTLEAAQRDVVYYQSEFEASQEEKQQSKQWCGDVLASLK